jgi:SAM-dependent methyltransferase
MKQRPFVRAVFLGAAAMIAVLLALHLLRGGGGGGGALPAVNDFNPAAFVAAPPRLDVPYVATDNEVVDAMLGLAGVRPDDDVIDLGSGDGRILIAAARSYGAHGLGVDIDPARIAESNANAAAAHVTGLVSFRRQDLFQTRLGDAEVLTLYLLPEINLRLRPRILAQMRPGTRVVSHDFDMGDWHWDQRRRIGTATVYLWIVPALVGGGWTLSAGGRTWPMSIAQSYQSFTGTIGEGESAARIEQGRLGGDHIRFIARLGEGRQVFEGRVDGNAIMPLRADAGWHAERAG